MTPIDIFNETSSYVKVLWSRGRATYEVIGIDGRILFDSQMSRTALHAAKGFESDYAELVQS